MSTDEGNRPGAWWQGAYSLVQTVATKSVVTPIQWVCAIVAVVFMTAIWLGSEQLAYMLFWLFAGSIAAFFIIYVIWMKIGPNRLHSEKHISDMRKLDMQVLGDDQHGEKELPTIINAAPVANSAPPVPLNLSVTDPLQEGSPK